MISEQTEHATHLLILLSINVDSIVCYNFFVYQVSDIHFFYLAYIFHLIALVVSKNSTHALYFLNVDK